MITLYTFVQTWLEARRDDDRGASLVEYALLVALIALVAVAAITSTGEKASDIFQAISDKLVTP